MNRLTLRQAASTIFIVSLLFQLSFCGKKPPAEAQIIQKIQLGKNAIESLEVGDLEDVLAEQFEIKGDSKNLDYDNIRKLLTIYKLRNQKVTLTIGPPEIEMDKHNTHLATSEMTVLITAGRGLLPDDGRIYKVTGSWRLFDDEWMLTSLSWK